MSKSSVANSVSCLVTAKVVRPRNDQGSRCAKSKVKFLPSHLCSQRQSHNYSVANQTLEYVQDLAVHDYNIKVPNDELATVP